MAHGKRFFLYCQHMAGTGHFVRTCEIAKALGRRHEMYLVDGGRPVPREMSSAKVTLVSLPRICRNEQGVMPFDSNDSIANIMQKRLQILLEAIDQFRPHAIVIEHFPFRRWELFSEIVPLIQQAREIDRGVKIVCSLRDIPGRSRLDSSTEEHDRDVLNVLHGYFDQILIHADPRVIQLNEQTALAGIIDLPMEYTGYVSQRRDARQHDKFGAHAKRKSGDVIVSVAGTGHMALLSRTIDSWNNLISQQAVGDRTLTVFLPLSVQPEEIAMLQRQAGSNPIRLLPYSTDFLYWMQSADLSISHAGYNTCTNVLETRTRSILVPNLQMSDQRGRARRFAERGLAATIDPAELTPQRLARAILDQLEAPKPQHDINLDGARITSQILERLCAGDSIARGTAENVSPIQAA